MKKNMIAIGVLLLGVPEEPLSEQCVSGLTQIMKEIGQVSEAYLLSVKYAGEETLHHALVIGVGTTQLNLLDEFVPELRLAIKAILPAQIAVDIIPVHKSHILVQNAAILGRCLLDPRVVRCGGCDEQWSDFGELDKALAVRASWLVREGKPIAAIGTLYDTGEFELADAKAIVNHITREFGKCHRCDVVIELGYSICDSCGAVIYNW